MLCHSTRGLYLFYFNDINNERLLIEHHKVVIVSRVPLPFIPRRVIHHDTLKSKLLVSQSDDGVRECQQQYHIWP